MHMDEEFTNELIAMQEIGRRRNRDRGIAFAIAFIGLFLAIAVGGRMIGIRLGVLYVTLISVPSAIGIAAGVVSSLTPKHIAAVPKEYSVDPKKLSQDEYLVD